ncbi:MFS transporter [Rhodococcus opacus]|uniref:MFS transporter n=1 Tax=Rhodococcus opacus TaxID=37919 RepID=UPI001C485466|nr:MFS transporter [Rhodococcus opacus]MBV6759053.1 MFS transporter [Rhodococcus opacus]
MPQTAQGSAEAQPKQSPVKVIRAAIVGTLVEYYDFGIFGYMATIMASLFFVSESDTAALLKTFATFAIAFFLRVPGGIFFGHIGDKYGRKSALSWTILLMVAATAAIGMLPTYITLGVWATVVLVLARCLQGFAAGGEIAGANAFVLESAPTKWRAFQTSMVNSGTYLGSLAASLVALGLSTAFTHEQIMSWAWRIPFLLSLVIGVIGIWIRNQMEDTPQFKELEGHGGTKKLPVMELLRTSGGVVVRVTFLAALITGGYYIASVYAATYLQKVGGQSSTVAFLSTSLALILGVITLPIAGYLADRYGRKPVLFAGSAGAAVLGIPMFILMSGGHAAQAMLGQSVLFIMVSVVNGSSAAAIGEMFKASVRYTGAAMGSNVSHMVLGGTAPFIATWLIGTTGSNLAPAGYFVFCALLTFGAVFFLKETKGTELNPD